jgi:hypothetical protein
MMRLRAVAELRDQNEMKNADLDCILSISRKRSGLLLCFFVFFASTAFPHSVEALKSQIRSLDEDNVGIYSLLSLTSIVSPTFSEAGPSIRPARHDVKSPFGSVPSAIGFFGNGAPGQPGLIKSRWRQFRQRLSSTPLGGLCLDQSFRRSPTSNLPSNLLIAISKDYAHAGLGLGGCGE